MYRFFNDHFNWILPTYRRVNLRSRKTLALSELMYLNITYAYTYWGIHLNLNILIFLNILLLSSET